MKRRSFLAGILASGFAPAFVGSSVLMPVKKLALPTELAPGHLFSTTMFDRPMAFCRGDSLHLAWSYGPAVGSSLIFRVERTGLVIGADSNGLVYSGDAGRMEIGC